MCVSYVHNPESTQRFYGINLKKRRRNDRPGNQAMEVARLVNDEENGCRFEVQKGRTLDTHVTYMVNSCQGKVAGVIL